MIIGTMLVAGIVMLMLAVVIGKRRSIHADDLGSVSDHWVAAHRADSQ
jgi:hypothetical protein